MIDEINNVADEAHGIGFDEGTKAHAKKVREAIKKLKDKNRYESLAHPSRLLIELEKELGL